jgi:biotin carboxyl carrier protein
MAIEITLKDRTALVELLGQDNNMLTISVDGRVYNLDAVRVGDGIYSIIYKGKSYNLELVRAENNRRYIVSTLYKVFETEVIDAETKYALARGKAAGLDAENTIVSPMPGKIVRIPVKPGDKVYANDTVIVVSAMKMESEYKAGKDTVIKNILVSEGDVVSGGQILVVLEDEANKS